MTGKVGPTGCAPLRWAGRTPPTLSSGSQVAGVGPGSFAGGLGPASVQTASGGKGGWVGGDGHDKNHGHLAAKNPICCLLLGLHVGSRLAKK